MITSLKTPLHVHRLSLSRLRWAAVDLCSVEIIDMSVRDGVGVHLSRME